MAKLGKILKKAYKDIDLLKLYDVSSAIKIIKDCSSSRKFDETVDIAICLGIDSRQSDQMVRGTVALPNGTGKSIRIAVFARGDKAKEATEAGADIVGAEDLMESIQKGTLNFDRCIASPDMMALVGRLGKILGPRGLMPNPKLGTVTMEIGAAVKAAKSGQIEFRSEKAGVVHAGIGKASFEDSALKENIEAFIEAIVKAKPSGTKGNYLKRASLSSTMGPGLALDINSVN